LIAALQRRLESIRRQTLSIAERPTVACIEWIEPLMAAGNWMPDLVAMAGGRNLFGTAGQHSPWMKFEDLAAVDPDVILIMPCGFNLERTAGELPALRNRPGWARLKAVREGRVYLADGNQFFNRPGPRIAESLEILAEILHPELFSFGHQGSAWLRT
jgi:iron complex transport system substrate-binding protein